MTTASAPLIVIPCLNEERHLGPLLDDLLADNAAATIVVADGGSQDRSRELVRERQAAHSRLHLLDNPQRLQSAGLNLAVASFGDGKEWLVRVDAHCTYPRGYAQRLVEAAAATGASCVVVPMVTEGEGCFRAAVAAAQNSWLGTGGSAHRHVGQGQWVDHGHHALIRLDLFRAVGGYREDMAANEDAELDARLLAAGARIWLEPGLALRYMPRGTPAALWRQYHRYGQGRARTLRLHRQRPRLRQLLPVGPPLALLTGLLAPWWPAAALPLGLWLLALVGGSFLLAATSRKPCVLMAGAAAGIMHLAWGSGFLRELASRRAGRTAPAS